MKLLLNKTFSQSKVFDLMFHFDEHKLYIASSIEFIYDNIMETWSLVKDNHIKL